MAPSLNESLNEHELYAQLNAQFFADALPPCEIVWSARLTRAAGNIRVQTPKITLSRPLLTEAFAQGGHTVCGVWCENSNEALREILKHEMIHLWLFVQGLPHGHTPKFRAKAREIGQSKTRHQIAAPASCAPKSGWIYVCGHCHAQTVRRRRFGRRVACARCCREFAGGAFDARFLLRGQKIGAKTGENRAIKSGVKPRCI